MLNTEKFKFWIIPKNVVDIEAFINGNEKKHRGRKPTRQFYMRPNKHGVLTKYYYNPSGKPRGPKTDHCQNKRDAEFVYLYTKEAKTLKQIGDIYGISRERVRQRLKLCGADKEIGGKSLKVVIKKIHEQKKESKSERNCFEMFGCSLEFRNKYGSYKQKKSVLMGYIQQRKNAAKRNIDWNITFPDWLEIWQDSGHLENRGRGTGKYAMTRVCDIGGYTKDNVVIKSFAENAQEARDMDAIKGRWQSVEYNGVVYRSLNRLCDDLHLPVGKIRLRLKCGMSLTEALERKIK